MCIKMANNSALCLDTTSSGRYLLHPELKNLLRGGAMTEVRVAEVPSS